MNQDILSSIVKMGHKVDSKEIRLKIRINQAFPFAVSTCFSSRDGQVPAESSIVNLITELSGDGARVIFQSREGMSR